MTLVDTSVWMDYFNGAATPQTERLDALLGQVLLGIGDLIMAEVLQGFRSDYDYRTARALLNSLSVFEMLGITRALQCADHYRTLRKRAITIRKTAAVIIATFCIAEGHALLYTDRDCGPFVAYLGLQAA